jgi:hypothetical protein
MVAKDYERSSASGYWLDIPGTSNQRRDQEAIAARAKPNFLFATDNKLMQAQIKADHYNPSSSDVAR